MNISIQPQAVKGNIRIPSSKSVSQRLLAAALLRKGKTVLEHFGGSADEKAALSLIRQLGAAAQYIPDEQKVEVDSEGFPNDAIEPMIHCGESGLALRMFSMIAALAGKEIAIEAEGSLRNRPLKLIEEACTTLGIHYTSDVTQGFPITIKGPLQPKDITLDGSITSQVLTGVLMAYAQAEITEPVTIAVLQLNSKPYIDLTLQVLEIFGMNVPQNDNYKRFTFNPKKAVAAQGLKKVSVEGDWSNAAFFLVAGAIAGSVSVSGLDVFSAQADKKIIEALHDCGCRMSITTEEVVVQHQALKAFQFDATDCPDLFPPLVVLAACAEGTSVIEGVSRLQHKESNRALTLQEQMGKMGVSITLQDDYMIVKGKADVKGATVDSCNDHRIAMAAAILALKADGTVHITQADAVNKSYPAFFDHLNAIVQEPASQS
ncbi:3-phosphoshikimate 1-carboxyvinyltransferase [Edaphocola flava]|uniref:3-phosphoshikimate 1-carboxyvinyltransferase n=1 Tax=Edaphocola flava TaxID=2499629 RepID=UPI00100B16AD|nr:3-phosphoshikimate 1-carboxyvinyltransferase [Edaphocola flava]